MEGTSLILRLDVEKHRNSNKTYIFYTKTFNEVVSKNVIYKFVILTKPSWVKIYSIIFLIIFDYNCQASDVTKRYTKNESNHSSGRQKVAKFEYFEGLCLFIFDIFKKFKKIHSQYVLIYKIINYTSSNIIG